MQPKQHSGGAESPSIPIELIAMILSCLPVKSLMQFMCVCKSWNSLISEPHFVNEHLRRQRRRSTPDTNPRLLFTYLTDENSDKLSISSLPIKSLLEAPSTIADKANFLYSFQLSSYKLIGSCNGLFSLFQVCSDGCWVRFLNPATRSMSQMSPKVTIIAQRDVSSVYCGFGHDHVSDTYKTVLFVNDQEWNQVKVFTMGGTNWRDIGFLPRFLSTNEVGVHLNKVGVYLNETLNWIAFSNNVDKYERSWEFNSFMIISFDLNKEEYLELSLPHISARPILGVLGESLSVSHHDKEIHFVVWQMKKFGDDGSWTKLLNISFQVIEFPWFPVARWFPLYIFDDGNGLMLQQELPHIRRDNRLQFLQIPNSIIAFDAMVYFESLITPR